VHSNVERESSITVEEISIKVNIADRHYPLKVRADQEENVRKAARLINDKVKSFFDSFSVNDKQDALSMCALELATDLILNQDKNQSENSGISQKILGIENLLKDIPL
jgi:cell division protein ZapA (FtsZ GTPase activity inhibitor)